MESDTLASTPIPENKMEEEIVYDNKNYIKVPIDSYVLEYPLVESDIPIIINKETKIPPAPRKLIRNYQARNENIIIYKNDTNGGAILEKSDKSIAVTDYVPYTWIPVCFENSDEIHWYKQKNTN